MMIALYKGRRIEASYGAHATCPGCGSRVISKMGEIKAWHWAHEAKSDCDPWCEGESSWHIGWKSLASPDRVEVVMGAHRADIVLIDGTVLELQHTSLSPEAVREREAFYGQMVWLIDATCGMQEHLHMRQRLGYWSFRWRWPRRWMLSITKPLLWDFGDELFEVRKIYDDLPVGGWGVYVPKSKLITRIAAVSEASR